MRQTFPLCPSRKQLYAAKGGMRPHIRFVLGVCQYDTAVEQEPEPVVVPVAVSVADKTSRKQPTRLLGCLGLTATPGSTRLTSNASIPSAYLPPLHPTQTEIEPNPE